MANRYGPIELDGLSTSGSAGASDDTNIELPSARALARSVLALCVTGEGAQSG